MEKKYEGWNRFLNQIQRETSQGITTHYIDYNIEVPQGGGIMSESGHDLVFFVSPDQVLRKDKE